MKTEIETNVLKIQKCIKTPSLQQHVSKSQGGQSTEQTELCGGKEVCKHTLNTTLDIGKVHLVHEMRG